MQVMLFDELTKIQVATLSGKVDGLAGAGVVVGALVGAVVGVVVGWVVGDVVVSFLVGGCGVVDTMVSPEQM